MKPMFMATALPMICQNDLESACELVVRCFSEAPGAPLQRQSMRAGTAKIPCTRVDEERKVVLFDLSPSRQPELLDFYEHYLADDVDHFATSPEQDPGFYRLARMFKEKPWPELKFIHSLTVGPYTMGLSCKSETGAPAFYDPQMRDIIVKYLAMRTKWRRKEIKKLFPGIQMLTLMAEPALSVFTSSVGTGTWDDIRNALDEVMDGAGDGAGIHCCANFDWSLLMGSKARIINFDAYRFGETLALYASPLTAFLARGGMVAWGIVPTHDSDILDSENAASLVSNLDRTLDAVVAKGVDRTLLMESSLITPSCDIAALSAERGQRVYELARDVSKLMRAKYFA
jgi:hypothetical protein